ncbi:hypothetical protein N7488_011619 [Penicillium malachiteum]|nr:hypothetical protein N7488_011619 [Penicillium malachiteum]
MPAIALDSSSWYQDEIGPRMTATAEFVFLNWSGLAGEELVSHLYRVRDQAWSVSKYPCVGLWMFLLDGIAAFPQFPTVLDIAKQPQAKTIDLGCGLGQDLRLLAAHGVSTENMWALDMNDGLWKVGYDLFRDQTQMQAKFIHADFLEVDPALDQGLSPLEGQMDLILASQFTHLFDWAGQLTASKNMVYLSKPGTMIVGFQQGRKTAREIPRPWRTVFYHNKDSFLQLWDVVQQQTGSRWKLDITEVQLKDTGMLDVDVAWMPDDHMGLNFIITREV